MTPHPHWIKRGRWGESNTSVVLRSITHAECLACRRKCSVMDEACFAPSPLEGFPDHGCGATFTTITSPFDRMKAECEQLRPDLPYKKTEWV